MVSFDPLHDETLPEGTSGLILGGGFPELHAAELSANERLRGQVAALARRGAPLAAECAGLLYLGRTLDGRPMCGVLDSRATMTEKLTLGYRTATAVTDSVLARTGERVRGHEFHRTAVTPPSGARAAWRFSSGELEGHVAGAGVASYLHTHWAGHPAAASRFAAACAARRAGSTPMKRLIGVGVGPGDPELVTVKAVRVLREADVVLVPVLRAARPPRAKSPAGPRRSSAATSMRTRSSAWSSH